MRSFKLWPNFISSPEAQVAGNRTEGALLETSYVARPHKIFKRSTSTPIINSTRVGNKVKITKPTY